jgi:hypothetical protein
MSSLIIGFPANVREHNPAEELPTRSSTRRTGSVHEPTRRSRHVTVMAGAERLDIQELACCRVFGKSLDFVKLIMVIILLLRLGLQSRYPR